MLAPEALLARILEDVPQPVWVVDHLDGIVFANPAACRVLGYGDAAELRGKPSHHTVHSKGRDGTPYPEAECPMLRPRQTRQTAHSEDEWLVRRDDSMFPIAWWSAPIDMPGGRGAVFAFTDISERLAAETAREHNAAETPCRRVTGGPTTHPRERDRGASPAGARSSRWGPAAARRIGARTAARSRSDPLSQTGSGTARHCN